MSILNSNLKQLKKQDKYRKIKRGLDSVLIFLCAVSLFATMVMTYKLGRMDERKIWERRASIDRREHRTAPYINRNPYRLTPYDDTPR